MELYVYTFEDADGSEAGGFHTQDYSEALEYAQKWGYRIIENTYEWTESNLVDDFCPTPREDDE